MTLQVLLPTHLIGIPVTSPKPEARSQFKGFFLKNEEKHETNLVFFILVTAAYVD